MEVPWILAGRGFPRAGAACQWRPTLKPSWRRTALFREACFECLSRKARRQGKRESSAHTALTCLLVQTNQPGKPRNMKLLKQPCLASRVASPCAAIGASHILEYMVQP